MSVDTMDAPAAVRQRATANGRRKSDLGFDDLKALAVPAAEDRDDWDPVKRDERIMANRKAVVAWDINTGVKQVIRDAPVKPAEATAPSAAAPALPPALIANAPMVERGSPATPVEDQRVHVSAPVPRTTLPLTFGLDSGDLTIKVLHVEEGPFSVMVAFPCDSDSMFSPKPGTALELGWGSKRVKVYYPGASARFEGLGAGIMAFIKTE